LWVFDFATNAWEKVEVANGPKGRYGFAAFIDENELFVFGGFEGGKGVVYNDLWALDLTAKKWKWRELNQSEYRQEFLGRYSHTLTRTPGGGLVILGGRNMDHTLCLYVEEGEERDKTVNASKDVVELTVSDVMPSAVVGAWIRSAYDGVLERNLSAADKDVWTAITAKHKIKRTLLVARKQKIRELALDSDGIFPDMTFKIAGDRVVPGHRILLLSNEEFLKSTPGQGFNSTTKEVAMTDVDIETFKYVKGFFYGCDIDMLPSHVIPVLSVAIKHNINGLKLLCEYRLIQNFADYDIFKLLKSAQACKSKTIVDYTMWYMRVNYESIKNKKEFADLDEETAETITKGQWPGQRYLNLKEEWDKKAAAAAAEAEGKKDEKCVVQ